MANADGGQLAEVLWDRARRAVEGPDSQGELINPDDVWAEFKKSVGALGLEIDLRSTGTGDQLPAERDDRLLAEVIAIGAGYDGELD